MKEPINKILKMVGTELDFGDFQIKGIPGFEVSILYKGEQTIFEVRNQSFDFKISAENMQCFSLTSGMNFIITDDIYNYTFTISKNLEPDLTGWAILFANYVSKSNV